MKTVIATLKNEIEKEKKNLAKYEAIIEHLMTLLGNEFDREAYIRAETYRRVSSDRLHNLRHSLYYALEAIGIDKIDSLKPELSGYFDKVSK